MSRSNEKSSDEHVILKPRQKNALFFLMTGVNPCAKNQFQQNLLHLAVMEHDIIAMKLILNYNKRNNLIESNFVNTQDLRGLTPLHHAIIYRDLKIASTLLECEANANIQDEDNHWTPLHHATMDSNLKMIRALLKYNADVNIQDRWGYTPLRNALMSQTPDIFLFLLTHNANIHISSHDGDTLLHFAATRQTDDIVQVLIANNVDINAQNHEGETPLHCAAREGSLKTVKTLIQNNADINLQNKKGDTPLHRCRLRSLKFLKEHVIKLKVAGLEVSKTNVDFVYNSTEVHERKRVEKIDGLYQEELTRMKNEVGDSSVSLHRFMMAEFDARVNYLNNESMLQALELIEWNVEFPRYGYMMQDCFKEALKRNELLRQASLHGASGVFELLPIICINKIYSYLNDDELKILIRVLKLASNVLNDNSL